MIEKITLKNFQSHEKAEVNFNPGLNILIGEVGSGKTSILEAVSFALFGKYANSVTQSELIKRRAEKAEVSSTFSTRSDRYKIERMIYPEKAQKAKLWMYNGGRCPYARNEVKQ